MIVLEKKYIFRGIILGLRTFWTILVNFIPRQSGIEFCQNFISASIGSPQLPNHARFWIYWHALYYLYFSDCSYRASLLPGVHTTVWRSTDTIKQQSMDYLTSLTRCRQIVPSTAPHYLIPESKHAPPHPPTAPSSMSPRSKYAPYRPKPPPSCPRNLNMPPYPQPPPPCPQNQNMPTYHPFGFVK